MEGQSRWLPDNAIEITLEITENDAKRTETILLEGFEPKTLVLREDPAHGTRELLPLIPVSGPLEPDKSLSVETRIGREVSIGAIYATLDRLEDKGYVTSFLGEPTPERGGKVKTFLPYYSKGIGGRESHPHCISENG